MGSRFNARLRRLEAHHRPRAEEPYTLPQPPPGWFAQTMQLLIANDHLELVLRETIGIPPAEVATVAAMLEEQYGHALTT